jgi:hypothetical protein
VKCLGAPVVLALVLAGGLFLGADRAPAASRLCPNTYGGDVIYAKKVRCKRARRVVRAWARGYKRNGMLKQRVLGFRCRARVEPVEGLTIHCRRGKKRIRFYANVPDARPRQPRL